MFSKSYAKVYDLFNAQKKYKEEIEFVYKWAGSPSTILDIGCGTASYWEYFPEEVKVWGIEKSLNMISNSRHKSLIFPIDAKDISEVDFFEEGFDLVTCLFDVVNYIQDHSWWKKMPLKKGGYFIFDIWDKEKVDRDGFSTTVKEFGNLTRKITPLSYDFKTVELDVEFNNSRELHQMRVWSHEDIKSFCGEEFEIVEVKKTKTWQTWYKCVRK